MGDEVVLHLPGADVETAPDDDVLQAPGDTQTPLFLDPAEVPGTAPAFLIEDFGRSLWVVPVTGRWRDPVHPVGDDEHVPVEEIVEVRILPPQERQLRVDEGLDELAVVRLIGIAAPQGQPALDERPVTVDDA